MINKFFNLTVFDLEHFSKKQLVMVSSFLFRKNSHPEKNP